MKGLKFKKKNALYLNICPPAIQIQKVLDHGHLLTVHDPEQESSELDTVILKALVKGKVLLLRDDLSRNLLKTSLKSCVMCVCVCSSACKSQSQEAQDFLDELKLAVAWNRVDIAKSDIFNGDVEWKVRDVQGHFFRGLITLQEVSLPYSPWLTLWSVYLCIYNISWYRI